MILADKIIEERKKNGWSQEELAEKLDVSRQSVSKWEGAQSTPDLQKILKMSELFGVSTDYLLKDEIEGVEYVVNEKDEANVHKVSMEEANAFLELNKMIAPKNAVATSICILSPICLIVLGGMTTLNIVSEALAASIGMAVLLIMIVCAVAMFIFNGRTMEKYSFLEKEKIETAYGVSGMVKERKSRYDMIHTRNIIIGVALCIIGVIALFMIPVLGETDFIGTIMLAVILVFEACGTFLLVRTSGINSGFEKLLQEGDYALANKKNSTMRIIAKIYWLSVTAVYLAWSFITNKWDITWVVWVIAGVLYPVAIGIAKLVSKNNKDN